MRMLIALIFVGTAIPLALGLGSFAFLKLGLEYIDHSGIAVMPSVDRLAEVLGLELVQRRR